MRSLAGPCFVVVSVAAPIAAFVIAPSPLVGEGIVNINFQTYAPLLDRMRQLNPNAYALADYFDTRQK